MAGDNKRESMQIRKKFRRNRKTAKYCCCFARTRNVQRFSDGYCCTYPQIYRRQDISVQNRNICRDMDDEIYLG